MLLSKWSSISSQISRRDPQSIAKDTSDATTYLGGPPEGCEAGDPAFPLPPVDSFGKAGGRGGSTTSETSRTGIGATAGGCASGAMSPNRPPTWTGRIYVGALSPCFEQAFPAQIQSTGWFNEEEEQLVHTEHWCKRIISQLHSFKIYVTATILCHQTTVCFFFFFLKWISTQGALWVEDWGPLYQIMISLKISNIVLIKINR